MVINGRVGYIIVRPYQNSDRQYLVGLAKKDVES
jgi:hypothetical protein